MISFCLALIFLMMNCGPASPHNEIPADTDCFTVDRKDYTVPPAGGELLIELKKNDADVSVLSSEKWCVPKTITRDGKNYVQVEVLPYSDKPGRSAGIMLSADNTDCPKIEVTIQQEGVDNDEDPDDGKRMTLKAASYNIRYASQDDKKTGDGWETRRSHLADLIKNHDFDIVGTQEGNDAQLADLKGALPGFDYVGHPYGGSNHTLHNCAIFYKTAKYSVLDKGVFWFSETPDIPSIGWDATDRRICYWAKFKDLKSGLEFYFFTAHFYWRYKTAKEHSGSVLVSKVREIAGDAPVISTGDYNSQPTTPQVNTILTLLGDAYDITETPPVGPEGTSFGGGIFQGEPNGRIDYIFVSDHFRVLNYAALTDSYNNGHYPSDHLPITAELSISVDL